MFRRHGRAAIIGAALTVALLGCTQQSPTDLAASLKGMEKSRFIACAGPPIVEYAEAGQDRMSFVTNLKRGATIGITSPAALPSASCSVDAVFQNNRLVSSSFSGDQGMCNLVFSPCLQK
jgi:hypothetical protein